MRLRATSIILILIAALYAAMSYITPLYLDDWGYMSVWRDDVGGGSFSLSTLARYAEYVRGFDNGRIPNITAPLESIFSPGRELFPLFTGLLLALSIWFALRFASSRPSALRLVVMWAFFILFIHWRDTLFERIYSFNYIWAGAVTLLFLWLLRRGERQGGSSGSDNRRGSSPWLFAATLVMAFLAGGWHEAFAAATLCGLFLLAATRRFRLSGRFYAAVAVYFIAMLIFALSPGMLRRLGSSMGGPQWHLSWKYFLVVYVFGLTVVCLLLSRKGRGVLLEALRSDVFIVCLGIMAAGFAIGFLTANTPRSFYWPSLAAIVATLLLIFRMPLRLSPLARRLSTLAIAGLCTAQTALAIYWQARYTEDFNRIMALLEESETGTVFYDSPNPLYPPKATLGIPYANAWRSPFHYHLLWQWYMTPVIGVVPSDLRDADLSEGQPSAQVPRAVNYRGHLIAPYERLDTTIHMIVPAYRYDRVAIPFITVGGDTLIYYAPL
ncbi:MAG: hypothetical protein J1F07_09035 [Muribaculaceae bacterium]|nr:hypothetical protein [Muribaculaceae bacterium]